MKTPAQQGGYTHHRKLKPLQGSSLDLGSTESKLFGEQGRMEA